MPTPLDETKLERAILALLADRRELYPSQIIGALRRHDAGLPLHHARAVLERLIAERRVARLWHRYLLPRDVEEVRATWLAMIDRQAARLDADLATTGAADEARALLTGWDGWQLGR
ncbi:hypothetical protein ACBY01_10380 [Sphingomonas sp. ac-8]|uniref:hypothetical protein n=1 Tax=Sphingomonas sp. ac-8 TaxID=3242977 RepID=UPI003A8086A2